MIFIVIQCYLGCEMSKLAYAARKAKIQDPDFDDINTPANIDEAGRWKVYGKIRTNTGYEFIQTDLIYEQLGP